MSEIKVFNLAKTIYGFTIGSDHDLRGLTEEQKEIVDKFNSLLESLNLDTLRLARTLFIRDFLRKQKFWNNSQTVPYALYRINQCVAKSCADKISTFPIEVDDSKTWYSLDKLHPYHFDQAVFFRLLIEEFTAIELIELEGRITNTLGSKKDKHPCGEWYVYHIIHLHIERLKSTRE